MRQLRRAVVVGLLAFMTSCQTANVGSAAGWAVDQIVASGQTLPDPSAEVLYSESTDFDLRLYSSLKAPVARLETVRVRFDSPRDALPSRLGTWASFVKTTGGNVHLCETNTEEALFDWIPGLNAIAAGSRLLPARDYNMIVEKNSGTRKVDGVIFFHRTQVSFNTLRTNYRDCRVV